jgi:alginate O-acetyltransferase complex protein AlgI
MYRGRVRVQRNFLNFLCYVTMFPQLVAGPIVRYSDVGDALTGRKITRERFSAGITRFAIGLAKKTLFANPAGAAAATLLSDISSMTSASAWLGIIMFAFQLYFDFSGYSDMAIGIGKMMGFDFPENFNYPYEARSITDFWRRWHISLVSFFRDYLYIPLGGNRKHSVRNIAIVWLLTGLWHGAGWNFILWGALNGALLLFERYVLREALAKTPVLIARCYTMIAVLFGFGVFYYGSFPELSVFIKAFFFVGAPLSGFLAETVLANNIWLIIVMAIAATSIPKKVITYIYEVFPGVSLSEPVFAAAGTLVCMFMLLGQTYNPFLYFRF